MKKLLKWFFIVVIIAAAVGGIWMWRRSSASGEIKYDFREDEAQVSRIEKSALERIRRDL